MVLVLFVSGLVESRVHLFLFVSYGFCSGSGMIRILSVVVCIPGERFCVIFQKKKMMMKKSLLY